MSHNKCTSCDGTGNGHGKDRYGEPNPCEGCNGLGYIDAVDDAPKLNRNRTSWFNSEERSEVHYLFRGKTLATAEISLCPMYGSDATPHPNLDACQKMPDFLVVVHYTPFAKDPAHRVASCTRAKDMLWFEPYKEEREMLAKRIHAWRYS
jgi:hypothetical protein